MNLRFGNEVVKLSLDSLNALGTFVAQCAADYCAHMRQCLAKFIKVRYKNIDLSRGVSAYVLS